MSFPLTRWALGVCVLATACSSGGNGSKPEGGHGGTAGAGGQGGKTSSDGQSSPSGSSGHRDTRTSSHSGASGSSFAGQGGRGGKGQGGMPGATNPDAGMPDAMPVMKWGIESRQNNTTCKGPSGPNKMPALLSDTGCFVKGDLAKAAPGVVPYTVNNPLWSDGAEKRRFFAIPDGTKIAFKDCKAKPELCGPIMMGGTTWDDGHLDFPAGAVLIKTFGFAGKLHETRFLTRFDQDNWIGYTYVWREDQSDADLLPDIVGGDTRTVKGIAGKDQQWHYPGRGQCQQCHIRAVGVSLGLELRQMNVVMKYPSGITSPQLLTLQRAGYFDAPLPDPLPDVYPAPTAAGGDTEAKARAYLHVNCGICHRPMGNFEQIDFRFDASLAETRTCNKPPLKDPLIEGGLLLVPGKPEGSIVSLRMRALNNNRMPQIGTKVVDEEGLKVVEDWISGLKGCPN